jgi:Prion-inhibition and propagation
MADIALGTIPLGASVLSGCLSGYKLFTEAKDLGKDSQTLLWKFRIQETRLRMWGKEWGLLGFQTSRDVGIRGHEDDEIVLGTLLRISDLLNDYKQLRKRYGLTLVVDDPTFRVAVSLARKGAHVVSRV